MTTIGRMGFNTHMYNDMGQRELLANLLPVVEEALRFVRELVGHKAYGASQGR